MPLNDEDLTRIKAGCLLSIEEHGNKEAKEILALIERLEAAEKALSLLCVPYESEDYIQPSRDALLAWRKAAGK